MQPRVSVLVKRPKRREARLSIPNCIGLWRSPRQLLSGVAKVERDQVDDYARRKGMNVEETERRLLPILNYIPADAKPVDDAA